MARKRKGEIEGQEPEAIESGPAPEDAGSAADAAGDFAAGRFGDKWRKSFSAAFPGCADLERAGDLFQKLKGALRGAGFGPEMDRILPVPGEDGEEFWNRVFSSFAKAGKWGSASGLCEIMGASGIDAYEPYVAHWRSSLSRALDLAPYGFSAVSRDLGGASMPIPGCDDDGRVRSAIFVIKSFMPLRLAFFSGSETISSFMTAYVVMWREKAWDFISRRCDFTTDFSMVGELRGIYENSCDMTDKTEAWELLNSRLEVLCGSEPPFDAPSGMADIERENLPRFMPELMLELSVLPASSGAGLVASFRFGDGGSKGGLASVFAFQIPLAESNDAIMKQTIGMGRDFKATLDAAVAAGAPAAAKMLAGCEAEIKGFGIQGM